MSVEESFVGPTIFETLDNSPQISYSLRGSLSIAFVNVPAGISTGHTCGDSLANETEVSPIRDCR